MSCRAAGIDFDIAATAGWYSAVVVSAAFEHIASAISGVATIAVAAASRLSR